MKSFILIILTLSSYSLKAQDFTKPTTLKGVYDAGGKIMNITAKISGNVTIQNAIIVANPFIEIFDTSVTFGSGIRTEAFSAMWYGAKSSNTDNSRQLQMSIEACKNRPYSLYIPGGNYKTSKSLFVANRKGNNFNQTSIKIYGDASFWDNGSGTKIIYSGNGFALGLQLNKGSEIRNIVLSGGWRSPGGNDLKYFNIAYNDYENQAKTGNGQGLSIDPFFLGNKSGSSGCKFNDLFIENFKTLIQISNTAGTQNAEIMLFENIQFGNAKTGVVTSQSQEKYNVFKGIYSWGSIHTLFYFSNSAGNYYLQGANIAGKCIRLFRVSSANWFPSQISDYYAENIGQIGNISTAMPMTISNSVFDFIASDKVGKLTLLTTDNNKIKFQSCTFRYYGYTSELKFSGSATFENCLFSGPVKGANGSIFTNYSNGKINNTIP